MSPKKAPVPGQGAQVVPEGGGPQDQPARVEEFTMKRLLPMFLLLLLLTGCDSKVDFKSFPKPTGPPPPTCELKQCLRDCEKLPTTAERKVCKRRCREECDDDETR